MSQYQLAQLNVALSKAPKGDPLLKDFFDNVARINALADQSKGFVWRMQGDAENSHADAVFATPGLLINYSVWDSLDDLAAFTYRSDHRDIMRRRKEWFDHVDVYMVLWWVPKGHIPTAEDAKARLETLRQNGPTPEAFVFKTPFPAPDQTQINPVLEICE